jgi:hypothetical protein
MCVGGMLGEKFRNVPVDQGRPGKQEIERFFGDPLQCFG